MKCRCSVHHVYAAPIASIIFDTFDSGHVQAQRERNKRQQDRVCMKLFMSYIDLKDVCSPGVYMLEEGVCMAEEAEMQMRMWVNVTTIRNKC